MFLGSQVMANIISDLIKDVEFEKKERFSKLSYAGYKKISRLDRKVAIIAFSIEEFLRQFPDYKEIQNVEKIKAKSSVLYLGLDLHKFDPFISENNDKEIFSLTILIFPIGMPGKKIPSFPDVKTLFPTLIL